MSICLKLQKNLFLIQIVRGGDFGSDLSKLKSLSVRKWNNTTKLWEVPVTCVQEIISKWEDHELFYQDFNTEEFVRQFSSKQKDIFKYAPVLHKIDSPLKLKPYQERYVRLNKNLRRLILAAATGSGKSLISTLRYLILEDKSLLIVCPKILRVNWQENLRRLFNKSSLIYWGTQKQKDKLNPEDYEIVITTYEALPSLKRFDFEHLIIDEAHLLSDPQTKRTKELNEFVSQMGNLKSLQLLTGTPIQHKPKNLWSLVHLVNPMLAGTYKHWCNEYEEVIRSIKKEIVLKDKSGNVIRDSSGRPKVIEKEIPIMTRTKNLHLLREKLSTIMYRVSKEDALECKENEELVYLDLTHRQTTLYNGIRDEILTQIDNKTLSVQHAPVRMLRLLQACEGLFNFNESNLESTKLEYLRHEIENSDEKIVVWSRFKPITYTLQSLYPDKVAIYNGDIHDDLKQLAIWAFNGVADKVELEKYKKLQDKHQYPFNPGDATVFSGVIDARASIGFDLHRHCSRQIVSSFSFLSSANAQAIARLVRLGQLSEIVTTQYLVCRDTIEPAALSLILNHLKTANSIIDGKDSISTTMISNLIKLLRG